MSENDRFQLSDFKEVFGELQSVHRVRRGIIQNIIIPGLIFFLLLGGVISYRETRDVWVIPVCVLPCLIVFCGIVWHLFSTRRDELRIYENGFTYRGGKHLQTCLWNEIENCHRRELNEQEMAESADWIFPLGSVEKKSGEIIELDHDLPGTPEIYNRFETNKSKRRKKR